VAFPCTARVQRKKENKGTDFGAKKESIILGAARVARTNRNDECRKTDLMALGSGE